MTLSGNQVATKLAALPPHGDCHAWRILDAVISNVTYSLLLAWPSIHQCPYNWFPSLPKNQQWHILPLCFFYNYGSFFFPFRYCYLNLHLLGNNNNKAHQKIKSLMYKILTCNGINICDLKMSFVTNFLVDAAYGFNYFGHLLTCCNDLYENNYNGRQGHFKKNNNNKNCWLVYKLNSVSIFQCLHWKSLTPGFFNWQVLFMEWSFS